jgi:uncharacterized SAM-binding protein YcdF (DUF218 family)
VVKVWRGLVFGVGGLLLAGAAAFVALAWQVDRLGRVDGARSDDVIVVLGARVEPDGQPGPDLSRRTEHAVELWQGGYAPAIICSGGFRNEPLSSAAVCRRYAISLGVPSGVVFVADGTTNTVEDAQAAARVMGDHGWHSALLVSHPLHLYRARWLFQQAGVSADTSPTSTDTEAIDLPVRVWYAAREAGAIVVTALNNNGWLPTPWEARLQSWAYRLP